MLSCVQLTTLVHVLALVRMYGSILMIYSIFRDYGAQDMQLEEMGRTGFFLKSNIWFGADFCQIHSVLLMHPSMREISRKQLASTLRCALGWRHG